MGWTQDQNGNWVYSDGRSQWTQANTTDANGQPVSYWTDGSGNISYDPPGGQQALSQAQSQASTAATQAAWNPTQQASSGIFATPNDTATNGYYGYTPHGSQQSRTMDILQQAAQAAGVPNFDFNAAALKAVQSDASGTAGGLWDQNSNPVAAANAILQATGNAALQGQVIAPNDPRYQLGAQQGQQTGAAFNTDALKYQTTPNTWEDALPYLPLIFAGGAGLAAYGAGGAAAGTGITTSALGDTLAGGIDAGVGTGEIAAGTAGIVPTVDGIGSGIVGGAAGSGFLSSGGFAGGSGVGGSGAAGTDAGAMAAGETGGGTGLSASAAALAGGATPGLGAATGTGAAAAAQRILSGVGTAADYASVLGAAAPGIAGAIGASQQSSALSGLANQEWNAGAPSRSRYEASMTAGFDPTTIPGYSGALDSASQSAMRALSATGGNPYGNPGGLEAAQKQIINGTALPAIQNYQALNGASGGYSALNGAFNQTATQAIGSNSAVLSGLGAAANNVLNPSSQNSGSLANWIKALSNSSNSGTSTNLNNSSYLS